MGIPKSYGMLSGSDSRCSLVSNSESRPTEADTILALLAFLLQAKRTPGPPNGAVRVQSSLLSPALIKFS